MSALTIRNPNRWFAACIAGYVVVLSAGLAALPDDPTLAQSAPFAVATAVLGVGALLVKVVDTRSRPDDVDRHLLVESTSIAFFVTMAGAVTWGLFEAFADAPRLSAWATWSGGMGAWCVASLLGQRRLGR